LEVPMELGIKIEGWNNPLSGDDTCGIEIVLL
jgi:hypothetical protein